MTDLSVIPEVKVETILRDHTLVVSTTGSVALICTACGGLKSACTYIGGKKDVLLNGSYTCVCRIAPGFGGDYALKKVNDDERRLLALLHNSQSMEELRLNIPIPRINDSYTVGFYDLLQMLHHCPSIEDARRLILHYASVEEMSEHG
jgi:hypothetical protein